MKELIPVEIIEKKIYLIRGHKVMLDRDLAELYGVETRVLNQAVRRNLDRFPEDFMFALTREEIMNLSQIVISSRIKHAPNVFVFAEQGVAMLSGVLNSERAIQVILFFSYDEEQKVKAILKELDLENEEYVVLIDARKDNKPSASNA